MSALRTIHASLMHGLGLRKFGHLNGLVDRLPSLQTFSVRLKASLSIEKKGHLEQVSGGRYSLAKGLLLKNHRA